MDDNEDLLAHPAPPAPILYEENRHLFRDIDAAAVYISAALILLLSRRSHLSRTLLSISILPDPTDLLTDEQTSLEKK